MTTKRIPVQDATPLFGIKRTDRGIERKDATRIMKSIRDNGGTCRRCGAGKWNWIDIQDDEAGRGRAIADALIGVGFVKLSFQERGWITIR